MELTLDEALQKGIEAHKAGQVQNADRYYTAILKTNPKHPDANHNMGVLAVGLGKVETALPFFKTALGANPNIAQYWLSYIDALTKLERITDAIEVFEKAKSNGAKGDAFDKLEGKLGSSGTTTSNTQEPSQDQLQNLLNLYTQGQYKEALTQASLALEQFPNSTTLYNILGTANRSLGKYEEAIEAYKEAVSRKPKYANAYSNMGLTFQEQGKLEEAIEAYRKAISIKPDHAQAYYNMGNAIREQGKLGEAIDAYRKALSIKPDYDDAYYNIGFTLREQGNLDDAIEAYTKALTIKPDYPGAHNNIGVALLEQGKLEEAIDAFSKAVSIKPDHAEAHRNLSGIKKYTKASEQFVRVQELYRREDLSLDSRCSLSFTLAKMYEDIGELGRSFSYLSEGNALRKKLLKYSINKDKELFTKLRKSQPSLLKNSLETQVKPSEIKPIFVLGMPRSGTTLVEQIISSNSGVIGAGELYHLAQFGGHLALDPTAINTAAISEFRERYLSKLSKLANGKQFVTDKMPQNFRFIPLICAAFPEAKIVHVKRNAAATCWSNYKQYFPAENIGYCYDLSDVIKYYKLYKDLMMLWQSQYGLRIYNLSYEGLVNDQENQTRKLIEYIGLNWEDACLSPHKNKRSVKTASQQQVRKKVYKGSSDAWRKYEPYLNGAFDSLSGL